MNVQSSVNSAIGSIAKAKFAVEAFNTAKANEAAKRAEREKKARQAQTAKARKAKELKRQANIMALAKTGITKERTPDLYNQAMKQLRGK